MLVCHFDVLQNKRALPYDSQEVINNTSYNNLRFGWELVHLPDLLHLKHCDET